MASIDSRIARTISGKPMRAEASAAPVQRNANTMPNHSSSDAPDRRRACRTAPAAQSRRPPAAAPAADGRSHRPASCRETRGAPVHRPRRSPIGRLQMTLTSATRRLSARMPSSSGLSPNMRLLDETEAVLLPDGARRRGSQVSRASGLADGGLAGREHRRRIDDGRDSCSAETCRRSAHPCRPARPSVDDAERRFAAGDQRQRGAHVLRARDLASRRWPRRPAFRARSCRTCPPARCPDWPSRASPFPAQPQGRSPARS